MSRATTKLATGNVSVTSASTAILLAPARSGRVKLQLRVYTGSARLYIGADDTVTTSTGAPIVPGILDSGYLGIDLETQAAVYGILSESDTVKVAVVELYD